MPAWAAFGALTVFLVVVLLLLSIVSASAVDASRPIADRRAADRSPADRSTALERREASEGEGRTLDGERRAADRREAADCASGSDRRERPQGATPGSDTRAGAPATREPRTRSGTGPGPADPRLPRFDSPGPAESGRIDGFDETPPGMSTGALLVNVALTQGLFGVALLAGAVYFEIPFSAFGLSSPLVSATVLAIGLTAGVGLWIGNELAAGVADAANVAYDEAVRSMLTPDSTGGWLLLLGIILPTIAFVEELLFRGAAIGALAVGFDLTEPLLLVVSSLAFGGAHGAQGRVGAAVATVLGFVLGAVFVLTGSLLVVVVAHYLVNALEFVVHEGLEWDRPLAVTGVSPRER